MKVSTLFDHLRTSLRLKELEIDENVNISRLSELVFTEVITSLEKIKFIKANISNKQLTALLTHVLNEGLISSDRMIVNTNPVKGASWWSSASGASLCPRDSIPTS